jgi:hypothetical protein
MHKYGSSVRSLRCKKDKLPDDFKDETDSPSSKVELESDSGLEKLERVRQWLSDSFPSKDFMPPPERCNTRQNQAKQLNANQELASAMADVVTVKYSEIYHPDFADWAVVVYPTRGGKTVASERTEKDEILQAIDKAAESISKVMGVPFCTFT